MSMQYGNEKTRDALADGRVRKYFSTIDEEGEIIEDKGRTKQEFAKDADINNIVSSIMRSGTTDWLEKHKEWLKEAGDVEVPDIDFKAAMDIVASSESRFAQLPSEIRSGFNNDPAEFLNFVQSENGAIELAELVARAKPVVTKAGSAAHGAEIAGPAKPAATPTASEPEITDSSGGE